MGRMYSLGSGITLNSEHWYAAPLAVSWHIGEDKTFIGPEHKSSCRIRPFDHKLEQPFTHPRSN